VNKESLKNAFQLFQEEGITLISKPKDSKLPTTIRLAAEWTPRRDEKTGGIIPEGRLWQFAETIARSRREGYVELVVVLFNCIHSRKSKEPS
jgi:hypothetical protein